ncbi:MAG: hypothetical protein GX058_00370 [Firmicutes bacterium]|nr:hypothetical protein [Bacillota bacterium]
MKQRTVGKRFRRNEYPVKTLLVIGLTTLGCVVIVNWYLSMLENQIMAKGSFVPVAVTAKDLEPGDVLELDDIRLLQIPRDACLAGVYLDGEKADLVGKEVKVFMQQGEQITSLKVGNPTIEESPRGKRWYFLEGVALAGSGALKQGDKVDILSVSSSPDGVLQVFTIAQNVTVSSIVSSESEVYRFGSTNSGVIVEVSLEQAQLIALAEKLGSLTLIKRADNDSYHEQIQVATELTLTSNLFPLSKTEHRTIEIINGTQSQLIHLSEGRD